MAQDVCRNLYEITAQLAFVPSGKDFRHLLIAQTEQVLHHPIRLGNELHIGILDAVVYHLDKMAGTGRSHPLTTGSAVRRFRRNALQDGLHLAPRTLRPSGHDGSAVQRSLFSSRHTGSHKTEAFPLGKRHTPVGVLIMGIAAVYQDVSFGQMGEKLFHQLVHRTAGADHHHDFAGCGYGSREFSHIRISFNAFPSCATVHKTFYHPLFHSRHCTVIYRNVPPFICHIESQIFAHHGKSDKTDVCFIEIFHISAIFIFLRCKQHAISICSHELRK